MTTNKPTVQLSDSLLSQWLVESLLLQNSSSPKVSCLHRMFVLCNLEVLRGIALTRKPAQVNLQYVKTQNNELVWR